jgi:6-phosphogluconolactonase (cycloisomerase 2 family)
MRQTRGVSRDPSRIFVSGSGGGCDQAVTHKIVANRRVVAAEVFRPAHRHVLGAHRPSFHLEDSTMVPFETLEMRQLLSGAGLNDHHPGNDDHGPIGPASTVVYIETNNPQPGQNAVLAYRRNPASGKLQPIGKFLTNGTGQANPEQVLGPDDSDQEVIASPDGKFLFAVNQGSDSIATFRIERNGSLSRIGTFDSNGTQPVSLGLAGNRLYVVNRGDALQGHDATVAPNYTGFSVNPDGSLTPIANSTITLPLGLSPAQALISKDGQFLFGDNFAIPGTSPALANTISPFKIQADGTLSLAPSGPVGADGVTPGLVLGTAVHPTQRIIYAGLTGASRIGVFTFTADGSLTFHGSVSDQGAAPCWIVVSADGKYLYTATTGTDTIGVFSLADPLNPVQIQEFKLAGPYARPGAPAGTVETADFQIALDPSGRSLYVVNQSTAADLNFPHGNQLHVLSVGRDGTLSESNSPVLFSPAEVPGAARAQGVAVVGGVQDRDDDAHGAIPASQQSISNSPFGKTRIDAGHADLDMDALLAAQSV